MIYAEPRATSAVELLAQRPGRVIPFVRAYAPDIGPASVMMKVEPTGSLSLRSRGRLNLDRVRT
jgi:hypothetical protein